MKASLQLACSALLMLTLLRPALADDEGSEVEKKKPAPVPEAVVAFQKELAKAELSQEQKTRIEELVAETSEAFAEAGKDERVQVIKDFRYEIAEYVLNKDQRDKLGLTSTQEAPPTPKRVSAILAKLKQVKLTEQQEKQVERLVAEVSVSFAATDRFATQSEALRNFRYNLIQYVLTNEQREKLGLDAPKQQPQQGQRFAAMLKKQLEGIELTEKQIARLKELAAEAAESWAKAEDNEAKKKVIGTLRYNVNEYVLTDEQRDKLKSIRKSDAAKPEKATDKKDSKKETPKAELKKKESKKAESKD